MNWILWRDHWNRLGKEGSREEWKNLRELFHGPDNFKSNQEEEEVSLSDWFERPVGFRLENSPGLVQED